MKNETYLTIAEAAVFLDIPKSGIYNLIANNLIKTVIGYKGRKRNLISQTELTEFKQKNEVGFIGTGFMD